VCSSDLLPGELLTIETSSFECLDTEAIVARARRHVVPGGVENPASALP
jgi:hypothetical protein